MEPWQYDDECFTAEKAEGWFGFVYRIERSTTGGSTGGSTGKFYIGKKQFTKAGFRKPKGKRRKRVRLKSDWEKYFGSCAELLADVEEFGPDAFTRTIIRLCRSKSELTYYEAEAQFAERVLFREDSYNRWIVCKVRQSPQLR